MMVFGTGTMVSSKLMLEIDCKDIDGNITHFSKPIYQSLIMFMAMSCCYPIHLIVCLVKSVIKNKRIKSGLEQRQELTPEEKKAKRKEDLKVCKKMY